MEVTLLYLQHETCLQSKKETYHWYKQHETNSPFLQRVHILPNSRNRHFEWSSILL